MSGAKFDLHRPFSTRQVLRPTIPSVPWQPARLKKLSSLPSNLEDELCCKPVEYATNMTQTELVQWSELPTERTPDASTFWMKRRMRLLHGLVRKRTMSLPEDPEVSFLLTPAKSIPPLSPLRQRLFCQMEARPAFSGPSYSVRGSGFRQRLPKSKLQPTFISLKEKLHTVIKGRRAVINGVDKLRNKSASEAMGLID